MVVAAIIAAAVSTLPRVIDWGAEKQKAKKAEELGAFVPFTTPLFGDGIYYGADAGIRLELLDRARHNPTNAALYYVLSLVVGVPYVWSEESLLGADCSGGVYLISQMLSTVTQRSIGAPERSTSKDLASIGRSVSVPKLGDIAIYGDKKPSHVEFCLGGGFCVGFNGGSSERRRDNLSPDARCRIKSVTWWTPLDFRRPAG